MNTLLILNLIVIGITWYNIFKSGVWRTDRGSLDGVKCIFFTMVLCELVFLGVSYAYLTKDSCSPHCEALRMLLILYLSGSLIQLQFVYLLNKRRLKYNREDEVDDRHQVS